MPRGKGGPRKGTTKCNKMKKEYNPNQPERRETVQDGDTEADGGLHPDNIVSLHVSDEQISILAPTSDPRSISETEQPHVSYQNIFLLWYLTASVHPLSLSLSLFLFLSLSPNASDKLVHERFIHLFERILYSFERITNYFT